MFEELLAKLGTTLKESGIPYMIIGGQAVLLYGEPRLTRDIDITLGVGIKRLEDILEVVKKLSLTTVLEDIDQFVKDTMVLPTFDNKTGIRVDFIFSWAPYERQAIERARPVSIAGVDVYFASVEDLIIHKIFAGRARDIEDVRIILLKNPGTDKVYIEKWLTEFDRALGEDRFLQRFRELINK